MRFATSSLLCVFLCGVLTPCLVADGTETLGPPSITLATGSGVTICGAGFAGGQPAVIATNVPATATVKQVLLYWNGEFQQIDPTDIGDADLTVDGIPVTGTLIGGPTTFYGDTCVSSFRADITGLGLVDPGADSVTVDDMDFNRSNNGAGLMILYEVPGATADLQLVDGNDLAYFQFAPPLDTTVPQTFTFSPAAVMRTATLNLFAASVGAGRTNVVQVDVGATTFYFDNMLASNDGDLWDSLVLSVPIAAGETSLTVQVRSEDRLGLGILPASLAWIGAGFDLPIPPPPGGGCTLTIGYWKTHSNLMPDKRDPTWDLLPGAESTPFFDTGLTWIDLAWLPPKGSAYIILAHQYIAAVLNGLAGADTTAVDAELILAAQLLDQYDGNPMSPSDIDKATRKLFLQLALTLDDYNNGDIGPGHCDDFFGSQFQAGPGLPGISPQVLR